MNKTDYLALLNELVKCNNEKQIRSAKTIFGSIAELKHLTSTRRTGAFYMNFVMTFNPLLNQQMNMKFWL